MQHCPDLAFSEKFRSQFIFGGPFQLHERQPIMVDNSGRLVSCSANLFQKGSFSSIPAKLTGLYRPEAIIRMAFLEEIFLAFTASANLLKVTPLF